MEVRPGYKRTEVGVIPEDWEVKRLLDVAIFENGKAHEQDIDDFGEYIVVNSKFVSTEGKVFKRSKKNRSPLAMGDIAMVMSDIPNGKALAKCFLVPEDKRYALNQRICRLRAVEVDNIFLFLQLNRNMYFLQFNDGVNQTNLRKNDILTCPLPIPPTAMEQRAIAAALSDVDALITALDCLIAKKCAIKQGVMQQLLTGKTRLPGFSGEWESASIEQLEKKGILRLSRGKVISRKDIEKKPGDYPIYSSSVANNGLFGEYGDYMFDVELVTWSVDGGGDFFYRHKHKFSVTNVSGIMKADTSIIDYRFLAAELAVLHGRLAFDYQIKAHPSVIRKLYEISLPPLEEQRAIATILSDMDAEIAALETRREKTRALKQGMMQELLTGRIRLTSVTP